MLVGDKGVVRTSFQEEATEIEKGGVERSRYDLNWLMGQREQFTVVEGSSRTQSPGGGRHIWEG